MSRIHLATADSPLREYAMTDGLCGAVIDNAQFAHVWDETPMHTIVSEALNSLSTCRKCIRIAKEKPLKAYVYAVRVPEKVSFREREGAVSE